VSLAPGRTTVPAMASIAKVVVEISLDREFDYRIPARLQSAIQVGTQVVVPFKSRELRGFVVGLANHSAFGDKLKEIAGVVGDKPLIPDPIMKLAYWIADYYCAPIEHAVRTVLPSAVRKRGAQHKKQLVVSLVNVDATPSSRIPARGHSSERDEGVASTLGPVNYFDPNEPIAHLPGGNLPHWRQDGTTYFVTFRLGDSLPREKLEQWTRERDAWLAENPRPEVEHVDATPSSRLIEWQREYRNRFTERIEQWLDAGSGSCVLGNPAVREIACAVFNNMDGIQYHLHGYVVMPNHVHVLVSPLGDRTLSEIIQAWKSVSSRQIKKLTGQADAVWQKESFDHIVRNAESLDKFRQYIEENPKNLHPDRYALHTATGASRLRLERDGGVASTLPDKQRLVIDALQLHGAMTLSELKERTGCSESPVRTLEKNGLVKIEESTILRDPHAGMELLRTRPFALMTEQQTALEKINAAMDREKPGVVLLHGVTGSGKTEVYLQAIQHALDQGKGAIVLVPEIALTPQTVDRFRSRFGDCVAVLHSSLSEGERHDEWHRIRNGEAQIAIGARSALFSPIENPGLIVVDEEHEATYKQDESPRYNARDVAVMRGHLENCCVVLGSATPSMESFNNVREGRYELAEMLLRVDDRSMPLMRVVDMRIEAEKEGRPQIFSRELVQGIYDRLDRREQVILFLNRRGFSSSLQCEQCGYVAECRECSVSMTYHKRAHKLLCHICGAEEKVPERCPDCGDPDFKYAGMGTEKIEEVLEKLCPKAKVARMDSDTMRKKDSYRTVLDQFRTGKIDILLGTQMIAKGLDFPNVTLVGVLYADMSLYQPDFRAGERTFQLLTQVAGRAGRGEKAGEVIVQAYTPHHPAIQAARNLDYDGFCSQDLEFRKELSYPPFSHLVLLTFKGESEVDVIAAADGFFARLEPILPESVAHSPPVPAPLARAKGHYRYQIMLRCEHTVKMTKPIRHVLATYKMPKGVGCTVDVDALSLL
jgi:primosomal protein N' (replication factor Y) (superfamily II helicase)